MIDQAAKARAFAALHERPGPLVLPTPWDAGSAKLLTGLGFEALCTSGAGFAFALGRSNGEGQTSRAEVLENARQIAEATDLPVTADLDHGFGDDPETCAETIRMAAATGVVGGSIEDATGRREDPIQPFDRAVARIAAAADAARALPFRFMLTARAENYLHGRKDRADTIARLRAFIAAGADVVYAPGLADPDDIAAIARAVAPTPLDFAAGLYGAGLSVAELAALGVKRINPASSLARAAIGALLRAAEEVKATGTFRYADAAPALSAVNAGFRR